MSESSRARDNPAVFVAAMAGVVLGLAVLLYGEANDVGLMVPAGGVIVLGAVGWLTGLIAGLDTPGGDGTDH